MKKENGRAIALEILNQVNEEGAYANLALDQALLAFPDLDVRDKGLITEIVYGSVKYRGRLDYILNQFATVKVNKMDCWARNVLRMSLYQMIFLDKVPVSAAVNEAVKLAKQYGRPGSDKFINGVLRSIDRGVDNITYPKQGKQPAQYLAAWYSFPQWIIERFVKQYGVKQAEEMCRYFNEAAPLWIRTNTLKISREALKEKLEAQGISVRSSIHTEEGLLLESSVNLHQLDLFQEGLFTVQDESSMLVALAAQPKPGQRVLDVCSAPGGKTTHLAQLMQNSGQIIACDIHTHRLGLVQENCKRLGITNVQLMEQDGQTVGARWPGQFDVVLVDAPCSGLGVLGRRPDSRWGKRAADVQNLAELQQTILHQAAQTVAPGGTLVYSTCTITSEENEQNVQRFLDTHPQFTLDTQLPNCWSNIEKGQAGYVQFVPATDQMDGFFIAKMKLSE